MGCGPVCNAHTNLTPGERDIFRSNYIRSRTFNEKGVKIQNIDEIKISEGLFVMESKGDPYQLYTKEMPLGESNKVLRVKNNRTNVSRAMKIINKDLLLLYIIKYLNNIVCNIFLSDYSYLK